MLFQCGRSCQFQSQITHHNRDLNQEPATERDEKDRRPTLPPAAGTSSANNNGASADAPGTQHTASPGFPDIAVVMLPGLLVIPPQSPPSSRLTAARLRPSRVRFLRRAPSLHHVSSNVIFCSAELNR